MKEKLNQEKKALERKLKEIKARLEARWRRILKQQQEKYQKEIEEIRRYFEQQLNQARAKIESLKREVSEKDAQLAQLIAMYKLLREKYQRLAEVPWRIGRVIKKLANQKVAVKCSGQCFVVNTADSGLFQRLRPGQEVLLNQQMNIIQATGEDILSEGMVSVVRQVLDKKRVLIGDHMGTKVAYLIPDLEGKIKAGDKVRFDPNYNLVLEKVKKTEQELSELELEKVPEVTFEQIGGLKKQIEKIKRSFVWPIVYREKFKRLKLPAVKGGLLVGPPGCGKTLIGKALANYLSKLFARKLGRTDYKGYFLYIAGPQLQSKWVGETERMLRELFKQAKEKSKQGFPVVLFFDEIEAFLSTRGLRKSSDVNIDYVSQFNALVDGMGDTSNILILGATNRPDMIDPAVIREGRLELKMEIGRPDKQGIKEIFKIYLTPDLPIKGPENQSIRKTIDQMATKAAKFIFSKTEDTEFMEVTYNDGSKEKLYFRDFISGSLIKAIVDRLKANAIRRWVKQGARPEVDPEINPEELIEVITELYQENKHLVDIHALKQEFVFRPGKTPVKVKSLIEEKRIKKIKGKLQTKDITEGVV